MLLRSDQHIRRRPIECSWVPSVYEGGRSPGLTLALEGGRDGAAELKTSGPRLSEVAVLSWAC